jgi:tRNA-guanine family transglycosylase
VALVTTGQLRLKAKEYAESLLTVDENCGCTTCKNNYTRALLHMMFKENNALAAQLLTKHNIYYMMTLMRTMRQAIMEGPAQHTEFVRQFFRVQYPEGDVPLWAVEALATVDIEVSSTLKS